jgi:hypothetical protein
MRAMIALMIGRVSSSETSVYFLRIHSSISQKKTFIFAAVKT